MSNFSRKVYWIYILYCCTYLEEEDNLELVKHLVDFSNELKNDRDISNLLKNHVYPMLKNTKIERNGNNTNTTDNKLSDLFPKFGLENIVFIDKFDMVSTKYVRIQAFDEILSSPSIAMHFESNPYQNDLISIFQVSTGVEVYVFDLIQLCKFKNNVEKLVEFFHQLFFSRKNDLIFLNARKSLHLLIKSLTCRDEHNQKELVEKKRDLCQTMDKISNKICEMRNFTKFENIKHIGEQELKLPAVSEKYHYSDWDSRPLNNNQREFAALEVQTLYKFHEKLFLKEEPKIFYI